MKVLAENRKARHDYFIEDTLECGIELKGTEVKSIRQGKVSIKEAWCDVENNELVIKGMNISPYEQGSIFNVDPLRVRKLLAHKSEIRELNIEKMQQGMTLIPIKIYLSNGRVKVEVGICKGKKNYDKRQSIKEKDIKRDNARNGY